MSNPTRTLLIGLCLIAVVFAGLGCATTPPEPEPLSPLESSDADVLTIDETTPAHLTRHDPVSPADGSHFRVYNVTLDDGEVLYAVVESSQFFPTLSLFGPGERMIATSVPLTSPDTDESDPFAAMYGDDSDDDDRRASVVASATEPGEYSLVVSSRYANEYGSFRIETQSVDESDDFEFPSKITSVLHDGKDFDQRTGAPSDSFEFSVDERMPVSIQLNSIDFSGELSLYDVDSGDQIATTASDDSRAGFGGYGRGDSSDDVLIQTVLAEGDYEISATSSDPHRVGEYTLVAEASELRQPGSFAIGERYESFLGPSEEQIPNRDRTGEPLEFEVDEPVVLDAVMRSGELDAYLVVTDDEGNFVTKDDDSGGDLDAHVGWPIMEPGEYTLWATSYGGDEQGEYYLETEFKEVPELEYGDIDVGQHLQAVLEPGDSRYGPRDSLVEYYDLQIDETQYVQIDMKSDYLDAYLVLEDEDGELIDENDDAVMGMTTDARINIELEPGTYRIGATTFGRNEQGLFNLSVEESDGSAADSDDVSGNPFMR